MQVWYKDQWVLISSRWEVLCDFKKTGKVSLREVPTEADVSKMILGLRPPQARIITMLYDQVMREFHQVPTEEELAAPEKWEERMKEETQKLNDRLRKQIVIQ